MKAVWRGGARWKVKADVAHQEIEVIRERDGVVTTGAVVEAATPHDAPMHLAFEWNDDAAAHQHRLAQARGLIRSIRIIREPGAAQQPAYLNVRISVEDEPSQFYQAAHVVVADDRLLAAAVAMLTAKLAAASVALDELKALISPEDTRLSAVAAVTEHVTAAKVLARSL